MKTIKKYIAIFKNAFNGFVNDKAMKLSGSLAYSAIFSLPPMLLLIILISGNVYGDAATEGRIYEEFGAMLGVSTAKQIQDVIIAIKNQPKTGLVAVLGFIAFVIGSTGIFVEIQDSLNMIWGVRPKAKKGFIKLLLSRVISFSIIIGLGLVMFVLLVANTIILSISDYFFELLQINSILPDLSKSMLSLINNGFMFVMMGFLFGFIFRTLPDVKISWKQVWKGSFLTSLLFLIAKVLIGVYLGNNRMATLYGAAGSVIILMLWIYFNAAIFYFGAEFTRAYAEYHGNKIIPNKYAEYTEKRLYEKMKNENENTI